MHLTQEVDAFRAQMQRYRDTNMSFNIYADGAILVEDTSKSVGPTVRCRWWQEFSRDDSGDRDQPSLAYALATLPGMRHWSELRQKTRFDRSTLMDDVFLVSEPHCKASGLCHWYMGLNKNLAQLTPKTLPLVTAGGGRGQRHHHVVAKKGSRGGAGR